MSQPSPRTAAGPSSIAPRRAGRCSPAASIAPRSPAARSGSGSPRRRSPARRRRWRRCCAFRSGSGPVLAAPLLVRGVVMLVRRQCFPRSAARRLALAAVIAALAGPAAAAEEVALVEDIDAPSLGIQFMDYLASGQVLRLRPGETIVIDYLRSCQRETIAGGNVTIGADQSLVA